MIVTVRVSTENDSVVSPAVYVGTGAGIDVAKVIIASGIVVVVDDAGGELTAFFIICARVSVVVIVVVEICVDTFTIVIFSGFGLSWRSPSAHGLQKSKVIFAVNFLVVSG